MMPGGQSAVRRVEISPFSRPSRLVDRFGRGDGAGVRIGVVDSGWDRSLRHPRVSRGVCLIDAADELAPGCSEDDADRIGHGTACTDLILRMAPAAEIVPIRVFGKLLETSPSVLALAIRWAAEQRLDVVNLSLGTYLPEAVRTLYAACEFARRRGTIIVAAAGTEEAGSLPAVFDNTIGVGTGAGPDPWDIVVRPGEAVEFLALARHPDLLWLRGVRRPGGTSSFAAPVVTGAVALLREQTPRAGQTEMLAQLQTLAAPHAPR
jgi:subtilisin family serine protease